MPHLVQQLAEITRDVKVAENLFALLSGEYENARIQEQRDTFKYMRVIKDSIGLVVKRSKLDGTECLKCGQYINFNMPIVSPDTICI